MLSTMRSHRFIAAGAIALIPSLLVMPAFAETATIAPGFLPNPITIKGVAGGAIDAVSLVNRQSTPTGECTGFTKREPHLTLTLRAFFNALSIRVQSEEDTALVIEGPGGVWCNDDEDNKNPGIAGQWLPGTYKIWVTTYAKDRTPAYTLRIRESR